MYIERKESRKKKRKEEKINCNMNAFKHIIKGVNTKLSHQQHPFYQVEDIPSHNEDKELYQRYKMVNKTLNKLYNNRRDLWNQYKSFLQSVYRNYHFKFILIDIKCITIEFNQLCTLLHDYSEEHIHVSYDLYKQKENIGSNIGVIRVSFL